MYCWKCGHEVDDQVNYCSTCGAALHATREEYSVAGDDLITRVKELIHEGNVTRIILQNEQGETLLEIPATVGVLGAIIAPWMAALGVIAALVTRCKIIVIKKATPSN
jgi:hypothetical protein